MAPAAPPRRARRRPPEGPAEQSLWDLAVAGELLEIVGSKRGQAGPLLRTLAAKIVDGAHAQLWAPLSEEGPAVAPRSAEWDRYGITEETFASAGLSRRAAAALLGAAAPLAMRPAAMRVSADGATTKLVLELRDGHRVETVVMRHEGRTTVCVSSQVGCQMGCTFCATGTMPVVSDLDVAEIVEQVLHAHALEAAAGRPPVRNAVFMGMGEPLNNYNTVCSALHILTENTFLGQYALPRCRVTVSTVGVVPRMLQLANDLPGVNLALSLHAPTQELRERIVPSARNSPLPELLAALDAHSARCRTMVEYVLLAGVNDGESCALELGRLMAPRARDVMVNLIPYNSGATSVEAGYAAPRHEVVERFQQIVAACGVTVRVRREMGRDIAGACGQLALTSSVEGAIAASGGEARDVEDFVAWRRGQPKVAKAAIHAECVAAVARAAEGPAAATPTPPQRVLAALAAAPALVCLAAAALALALGAAAAARSRHRRWGLAAG